jgi:hypothetical protein
MRNMAIAVNETFLPVGGCNAQEVSPVCRRNRKAGHDLISYRDDVSNNVLEVWKAGKEGARLSR